MGTWTHFITCHDSCAANPFYFIFLNGFESIALLFSGDNGVKLVECLRSNKKRETKINFSFIQNEKHLELEGTCVSSASWPPPVSGRAPCQSFTSDFNIQFVSPPLRLRTRASWTRASSSHPAGAEFKSLWPQGELSISHPSALPHQAAVALLLRVKIRPQASAE